MLMIKERREAMTSFRPTEYVRPQRIEEAVESLSSFGEAARAIAGGTDLMVQKPPFVKCLVDLTNLNLGYIDKEGNGIKIGALTRISELEASPVLQEGPYAAIAAAARSIGSPGIRNMATLGGNLCNGAPSADMPPSLMGFDAEARIFGPEGARTIALGDFFIDAGKTVLKYDEILMEVFIAAPPAHTGTDFQKVGRTAVDLALANVGVRLTCDGEGRCEKALIVLGAVAPTPMRAVKAEELLKGERITEALIEKAAITSSAEAAPIDDVRASAEYRRELIVHLTKNALRNAHEMALGKGGDKL
ncbi:MAG: xanthine dehydrogenase family protein subunit M [Deltaproteobacteria bacterium]|nr:xanthine dehydrogenase family protein subunit M [Deltaproteobacteria bacterium]